MRALNIIINDLKKLKNNMAMLILLLIAAPMLIGFIEVSIFTKAYNGESTISKFNTVVIDEDNGTYSSLLKKTLISKNMRKITSVTTRKSEIEAENDIKNDKISTAVIIPEGFSKSIENGNYKSIKLLKSPTHKVDNNVIESILKSFVNTLSLKGKNVNYVDTIIIKKQQRVNPSQHYFLVMLSAFMIFTIFVCGSNILKEKQDNIASRINSTGTNKYIYFYSKLVNVFILSFFQSIIYIILTVLFFKVDYGNNYLAIMLIVLAGSLALTGLTAIGTSLIKNIKVFRAYSYGIYILMGLFSGCFGLTLETLPDNMIKLAPYTFNYNYYKAYNVLMLGGNINSIQQYILILIFFGITACILSSIIFKVEVTN